MKEKGGGTGVLVGLDLPSAGGGNETRVDPHSGTIVWVRGEIFKAESETVDLWQPKWLENQTVLAAAIHTWDWNASLLEGAVAGSWSLGIVEQSQNEGCCWPWKDGLRGCEGWDPHGKCQWRKARQPWKQGDTAESHVVGRAIPIAALSPHTSSLPTYQHGQLNHKEAGPSNTWHTELQSRTPPRVPL